MATKRITKAIAAALAVTVLGFCGAGCGSSNKGAQTTCGEWYSLSSKERRAVLERIAKSIPDEDVPVDEDEWAWTAKQITNQCGYLADSDTLGDLLGLGEP